MKDENEPLNELAKTLPPNTPISPLQGIAAIALQMSLKYHDIGTVKDGALYQQYKIEGKNMIPFHLDMVFETAIAMEKHLMGANERISQLLIDSLVVAIEADEKAEEETPS